MRLVDSCGWLHLFKDTALASEASNTSLAHGLAMADAIVYATACQHEATLYTSDVDLKGLSGAHFISQSPSK